MKQRTPGPLLAALLTLTLLCPPVRAAAAPTLRMDGGSGTGSAQLTLQSLGDQQVSSVQLELTLTGSYPKAGFQLSSALDGRYSYCRAEESGNQTTVTIYIDGVRSMNQNGAVPLGTLSLGGGYSAPSSARLTILDRSLTAVSSTVAVQSGSGGSSDSSSGGDTDSSYSIRTSSTGGGSVAVSPSRAQPGETVTITAQADSGCQLSALTASTSSRQLQLSDIGGGRFTFSMPAASVEVKGTFTSQSVQQPLPFTDVPEGIWFHDAVAYAYANGLMAGTGASTFSPDLPTSRGMIVTILHRLAGAPDAGSSSFTDVADGQYYAKAVAWASANGVVSGYGNGRFGPNDPITREQMAVILRGYARLNGADVSAQISLSGYSDADQISAYALDAMGWACAQGLINGTSATTLAPGGTATRAQAAVILKGFCQTILPSS